MKRLWKPLLVVIPVMVVTTAWLHNVPTDVTDEDLEYIRLILEAEGRTGIASRKPGSFEAEIQTILEVQDTILSYAPEDKGIPVNLPREPRTLYEVGYGLCYDRSRAIEKTLNSLGFETRHVAVYRTDKTGSALISLLTPRVGSHAVSEVKTSRGWLVIDPNRRWISLASDGTPWSISDLQEAAEGAETLPEWTSRNGEESARIFTREFTYVPGLYSRHGKFYAPFTPVPDINWPDFLGHILAVS